MTSYVALTVAGARSLSMTTTATVSGMTPARFRRSSQKRAHDLAVGEVAIAVLSLALRGAIDLQGIETDDTKLGASVVVKDDRGRPERVHLRPDAYVQTKDERGPVGLLVEVDRGTISPGTMRARYEAYLAWSRDDGPRRDYAVKAMRVVTVVPTEARLSKLHDAAFKANGERPSGFLLFALQGDVMATEPERLMGPVARVLGRDLFAPIFGRSNAGENDTARRRRFSTSVSKSHRRTRRVRCQGST